MEIPKVVSSVLKAHKVVKNPELSEINQWDAWARDKAHTIVDQIGVKK
jgi:1-deoxy-D-xylulose 5-phosphate reductoisomerase